MITLNSERGFVKIDSWEDIETLPGFTVDLNPKEHELKEIIGRYIFKDYIKCGLSSCHTPHGKGYIVSTKSGPITNIGHNCGKNHFNIEFDQLSKSFERDVALHNYRENIGSFLITIDLHKEKLSQLRKGELGADSLHRKAQLLTKKSAGCPEMAALTLSKMIRARNQDVLENRLASKEEREDLEAIQGKSIPNPYYIEEKAEELTGLSFLYPENNLRELIVSDLEAGFKSINDLDIDNGSFKELKHWSSWCSEVDRKIENIERIIEIGKTLLVRENLLKILVSIQDAEQKKEYRAFINKNM